jgi:thymidylate kinase
MISVALIGPDGAGKTTIAEMLEESFPLPVKVLYMGVNLESSNVTLPTSRLIRFIKQTQRNRARVVGFPHPLNRANRRRSGKIRAVFRLLNRLAEEYYRQLLAWNYQRKGMVVVYDRHFQFDFEYDVQSLAQRMRLSDRLHCWCLARLYPRPDMVLYLDAPGEVLFARKGEATVEWLEVRRQAFLRQGARTPNFVPVDATQPLELVYAAVSRHILEFCQSRQVTPDMLGSSSLAQRQGLRE